MRAERRREADSVFWRESFETCAIPTI